MWGLTCLRIPASWVVRRNMVNTIWRVNSVRRPRNNVSSWPASMSKKFRYSSSNRGRVPNGNHALLLALARTLTMPSTSSMQLFQGRPPNPEATAIHRFQDGPVPNPLLAGEIDGLDDGLNFLHAQDVGSAVRTGGVQVQPPGTLEVLAEVPHAAEDAALAVAAEPFFEQLGDEPSTCSGRIHPA